jgi:hypothetical protein
MVDRLLSILGLDTTPTGGVRPNDPVEAIGNLLGATRSVGDAFAGALTGTGAQVSLIKEALGVPDVNSRQLAIARAARSSPNPWVDALAANRAASELPPGPMELTPSIGERAVVEPIGAALSGGANALLGHSPVNLLWQALSGHPLYTPPRVDFNTRMDPRGQQQALAMALDPTNLLGTGAFPDLARATEAVPVLGRATGALARGDAAVQTLADALTGFPGRLSTRAGLPRAVLPAVGGALGGGILGPADTPQDRLRNALLGAGAGALFLSGHGGAAERVAASQGMERAHASLTADLIARLTEERASGFGGRHGFGVEAPATPPPLGIPESTPGFGARGSLPDPDYPAAEPTLDDVLHGHVHAPDETPGVAPLAPSWSIPIEQTRLGQGTAQLDAVTAGLDPVLLARVDDLAARIGGVPNPTQVRQELGLARGEERPYHQYALLKGQAIAPRGTTLAAGIHPDTGPTGQNLFALAREQMVETTPRAALGDVATGAGPLPDQLDFRGHIAQRAAEEGRQPGDYLLQAQDPNRPLPPSGKASDRILRKLRADKRGVLVQGFEQANHWARELTGGSGYPVDPKLDAEVVGAAKMMARPELQADPSLWRDEVAKDFPVRADGTPMSPKDYDSLHAASRKYLDTQLARVVNEDMVPHLDNLVRYMKTGVNRGVTGWYENTLDWLGQRFGSDAPIFVEFLAATSPNNEVSANATAALKAYTEWKFGYRPGQMFGEVTGRDAEGNLVKTPGYLGLHRSNLNHIFDGTPWGDLKVQDFLNSFYEGFLAKRAAETGETPLDVLGKIGFDSPAWRRFSDAYRNDPTARAVTVDVWDTRAKGFSGMPRNAAEALPKLAAVVAKGPTKDVSQDAVAKAAALMDDPERLDAILKGHGPEFFFEQGIPIDALLSGTDAPSTRQAYLFRKALGQELGTRLGITPREGQAGLWFGAKQSWEAPGWVKQPASEGGPFEQYIGEGLGTGTPADYVARRATETFAKQAGQVRDLAQREGIARVYGRALDQLPAKLQTYARGQIGTEVGRALPPPEQLPQELGRFATGTDPARVLGAVDAHYRDLATRAARETPVSEAVKLRERFPDLIGAGPGVEVGGGPTFDTGLTGARGLLSTAQHAAAGAFTGGVVGGAYGAASVPEGSDPETVQAGYMSGASHGVLLGLLGGGALGSARNPEGWTRQLATLPVVIGRTLVPKLATLATGLAANPDNVAYAARQVIEATKHDLAAGTPHARFSWGNFWRDWAARTIVTPKNQLQDYLSGRFYLGAFGGREALAVANQAALEESATRGATGAAGTTPQVIRSIYDKVGLGRYDPEIGQNQGMLGGVDPGKDRQYMSPLARTLTGAGQAMFDPRAHAALPVVGPLVFGGLRGLLAPGVEAGFRAANTLTHDAHRWGLLGKELSEGLALAADDFLPQLGQAAASLDPHGLFSPQDVAAIAGPQAAGEWEARVLATGAVAEERVLRVFGDYNNTTILDRTLGKIAPFTRWATRTIPPAVTLAARHPGITAGIAGAVEADKQRAREEGRPPYTAGTVPIPGTDRRADVLSLAVPAGGQLGGEERAIPADATPLETAYLTLTNTLGRVGFQPHPAGQIAAYMLGLDRAPGALDRFAGIEQGLGGPAVPNLPREGLDWARRLTGHGIPADPVENRMAELWMAEHGEPLSRSEAGLAQSLDPTSDLYRRAVADVRAQNLGQNVISSTAPVTVSRDNPMRQVASLAGGGRDLADERAIAALDAAGNPRDAETLRQMNAAKLAAKPEAYTYRDVGTDARKWALVDAWERGTGNRILTTPGLGRNAYNAARKQLLAALGLGK